MATDSHGNIYYSGTAPDLTTQAYQATGIYELLAVNGSLPAQPSYRTLATVGSNNVSDPFCLTVDTQGNLFFVDQYPGNAQLSTIKEIAAINGSIPDNPTNQVVLSGRNFGLFDLAVGNQGNLYFTYQESGGYVSEYLDEAEAVNGVLPSNPTIRTLFSQSTYTPNGGSMTLEAMGRPSVDSRGDLFWIFGDTIKEFVATNGTIPRGATAVDVVKPSVVGVSSSSESPFTDDFRLDKNGDLFYAVTYPVDGTTFHSQIDEYVAVNGVLPPNPNPRLLYDTTQRSFQPYALIVDTNGNVFISNYLYGYDQEIDELIAGTTGGLTIAPATQAFGNLAVQRVSPPQTSTITNTTNQAISLSMGSLTDSTDFTQVDNCGGGVAANGGTCTVSFTFTPQSAAALTSTYSIHDLSNPGSPVVVTLSGTGTNAQPPQATLTPASANFGTVTIGSASTAQTFTLTNIGMVPVAVGNFSLGGQNAVNFVIGQNNCRSGSLAVGATCTVLVTFSPASAGSLTASLAVSDDAGTQTSALSGVGAAPPAPNAVLTPSTANFGTTTVGTSSAAQTFTLANTGNAVLPIASVGLSGANASSFKLGANTCGTSLAAGSSCTMTVSFSPAASGSFMAVLAVADSVGTQTSTLTGASVATAADFSIAATPAAQSSYRGTSVSYTIQLASADANVPFMNAITLSAVGFPSGASVSFSPASVVPGTAGSSSKMTVTIPVLSAQVNPGPPAPPFRGIPAEFSVASLICMSLMKWRVRRWGRLLALSLIVLLTGAITGLTGCSDTRTGFAIPTSASTITVTGTSGSISHSATVTLSVQ